MLSFAPLAYVPNIVPRLAASVLAQPCLPPAAHAAACAPPALLPASTSPPPQKTFGCRIGPAPAALPPSAHPGLSLRIVSRRLPSSLPHAASERPMPSASMPSASSGLCDPRLRRARLALSR